MNRTMLKMIKTIQKFSSSSLNMIFRHILEFPELIILTSDPYIFTIIAALLFMYLAYKRRAKVYLLDFTCYRPPNSYRLPMSMFHEHVYLDNQMDQESVDFQVRVLEKSGFSEQTCIPPSLAEMPIKKSLSSVEDEAMTILFSAVAQLLKVSKINPRSIDILITNCSLYSPTPSLSAMVINKFRMRSNIKSFNLSGMGCAAGILSVSLAKDLLRVHLNSLALIVSTETLHSNWYTGKNKSMLLTNCLFRMGGAAVLMSSRDTDRRKAKYELKHIVRTNKAQDDRAYSCIYQDVDSEKKLGVLISKDVLNVAGESLKINIASIGPMVLPCSEQLRYVLHILCKKLNISNKRFYIPDFKRAFEHFCIHTGGRAVIQAMEKNLGLRKEAIEPSKMTLYRFGNTSSSSIWYELSYIEAKGRMKRGDRIWQIAFGSGFKCNSAVWKCVRTVGPAKENAWMESIDLYPVEIPDAVKINLS